MSLYPPPPLGYRLVGEASRQAPLTPVAVESIPCDGGPGVSATPCKAGLLPENPTITEYWTLQVPEKIPEGTIRSGFLSPSLWHPF